MHQGAARGAGRIHRITWFADKGVKQMKMHVEFDDFGEYLEDLDEEEDSFYDHRDWAQTRSGFPETVTKPDCWWDSWDWRLPIPAIGIYRAKEHMFPTDTGKFGGYETKPIDDFPFHIVRGTFRNESGPIAFILPGW